jgi:hypothetical protein
LHAEFSINKPCKILSIITANPLIFLPFYLALSLILLTIQYNTIQYNITSRNISQTIHNTPLSLLSFNTTAGTMNHRTGIGSFSIGNIGCVSMLIPPCSGVVGLSSGVEKQSNGVVPLLAPIIPLLTHVVPLFDGIVPLLSGMTKYCGRIVPLLAPETPLLDGTTQLRGRFTQFDNRDTINHKIYRKVKKREGSNSQTLHPSDTSLKGNNSQTLRPSDTSLKGRNLRVARLLKSLFFGEKFREVFKIPKRKDIANVRWRGDE